MFKRLIGDQWMDDVTRGQGGLLVLWRSLEDKGGLLELWGSLEDKGAF